MYEGRSGGHGEGEHEDGVGGMGKESMELGVGGRGKGGMGIVMDAGVHLFSKASPYH